MIETCSLCPDITCVSWKNGRTVVSHLADTSSYTEVPIKDCSTRINMEALNLEFQEMEDKTGDRKPLLLGC